MYLKWKDEQESSYVYNSDFMNNLDISYGCIIYDIDPSSNMVNFKSVDCEAKLYGACQCYWPGMAIF